MEIRLEKIIKEYGADDEKTYALRGVSFEIKKGEFVAIMGSSGSGKSTLLHILGLLDRPSSGRYIFDGTESAALDDKELAQIRNKKMGFIFQAFNLLGTRSVYDNVMLPLVYNRDLPDSKRRARVENAIVSVGLREKMRVSAGKLSGGQKQRVAIARALVNDPDIIFADEPTGNLDSASGAQVMEILNKLHTEGHTVILVTHETYTAEFAQRLIRVKDGLIVEDRPIENRRATTGRFIK